MASEVGSAYTALTDTSAAAEELGKQLAGVDARVVVFFHSVSHDGRQIAQALKASFPNAQIAGASSCGEFTDKGHGIGGVSAIALDSSRVEKAASVMVPLEGDVHANVRAAMATLSKEMGVDLREVDPATHVGLVLIDSTLRREEEVNEALGNAAPLLSFVGGSAGDDMQLKNTWVHTGCDSRIGGAALVIMKMRSRFQVMKTCNYDPTGNVLTVTKVDPAMPIIWEIDGKPAAEVYAKTMDLQPSQLTPQQVKYPLALVIDGKPWLRSVITAVPNGGLLMACRVKEGMQLQSTRPRDIIDDARHALQAAAHELGATPAGGLIFNCVGRRVEIQRNNLEAQFYSLFHQYPTAGFHAHGESWLGHINHTLTALLFA